MQISWRQALQRHQNYLTACQPPADLEERQRNHAAPIRRVSRIDNHDSCGLVVNGLDDHCMSRNNAEQRREIHERYRDMRSEVTDKYVNLAETLGTRVQTIACQATDRSTR
jgi:hypothetical protein